MTRRSLLSVGATAGAAVALGVRPWAAAAAGPGYLSRSAYAGLEGTTFTVETGADPVVLRLESVSDVAGAASRRALAGSDDAFALKFSGPLARPLDSGIHTMRHPQLGTIELFASPVDAPEADRNYEVVVDRSVGAPARSDAPERRAPDPVDPPEAPPPAADSAPSTESKPAAQLVRRVRLRRAGRWIRCEVVLDDGVKAQRVRCRLLRDGRRLASGAGELEAGRAVMRLEGDRPLGRGVYTLVVSAVRPGGKATSERRRVTVR